jgi:hypothetical protein
MVFWEQINNSGFFFFFFREKIAFLTRKNMCVPVLPPDELSEDCASDSGTLKREDSELLEGMSSCESEKIVIDDGEQRFEYVVDRVLGVEV